METSTVQTYEDSTNVTTAHKHFRIRQGGKYICFFSIQICGKGQICSNHQPNLDSVQLNKLDKDV